MANFLIAYKKTGGFEGGYTWLTGDSGGETYCGIARNYWPKWAGWPMVDGAKPIKKGSTINSVKLDNLVHEFYKKNFWDVIDGDKIEDQSIANTLYDLGVNAGTPRSIKQIQAVLGFPQDGKITQKLIDVINNPTSTLLK